MRQKNICPSIYRNNKYSYVRKCKVVALRVVLFLRQFCATRGAGNQHVTKSYESAVVFLENFSCICQKIFVPLHPIC